MRMRAFIAMTAIALILSGMALASNYTVTSVKPNSVSPGQNTYILITIQNNEEAASQVRAFLVSETDRIIVTDSWEYLGFVDWKEKKTAIFAVQATQGPEDECPMRLEIKESTGPIYVFNFSLPISNVPLTEEIEVEPYNGEEYEDDEIYEEDWETTNFKIEAVTLLDESDARIDPTDKVTLIVKLRNKNTDGVFSVYGKIIEDFDNIKAPILPYDFNRIGGKETVSGYFDIETIDVTPGDYKMNLSLTYDKDGREHITKIPFAIRVDGGYSVSVDLLPDSIEASPLQQLKFKVHIKNTGIVDDTYKIYFRGVSEWVQQAQRDVMVAKHSDRDVEVTLLVPALTGTYTLTTEVISKTLSDSNSRDTSVIIVRPEIRLMHQVDISVDRHSTDVTQGEGETFNVKVQNLGTAKDAVTIKVKGADWAYLSPSTLELDPYQTKQLTLYVAPPWDARVGTYTLNLTATTFGGEASSKEQVAVYVAEASYDPEPAEQTIQVNGQAGIEDEGIGITTGFSVLAKDIKGFSHPILTLLVIALLAAIFIMGIMRKEEPEKIMSLGHQVHTKR